MADEKPVHHTVQNVYHLGNGHGNGHAENVAGHTAPAEILFRVQTVLPSPVAFYDFT